MKSLKKAFFISFGLHVFFLGLISLRFPEREKPSLVKVRLVSISRASLQTPAFQSFLSESNKKGDLHPPNKENPQAPEKSPSKPQRTPQKQRAPKRPKKKSPSRPKPRKAASSETKASTKSTKRPSKAQNSSNSQSKLASREESLLEEHLAELKLREKLAHLEKEVATREKAREGGDPGSPGQGFSLEDYKALIKAHLDSFFEVPLTLKSRKNLSATVEIRLDAQGRLLSYRLLKSSGNFLWDRTVEAAVRAADPYPPPGRPVTIKAIFTPQGLNL